MKKIFFCIWLVCLSVLSFASVDFSVIPKKEIIPNNGVYTVEWKTNRDIECFSVNIMEVFYQNGQPYADRIIYSADTDRNRIEFKENTVKPGCDYFCYVLAKTDGKYHLWYNVCFTPRCVFSFKLPRNEVLIFDQKTYENSVQYGVEFPKDLGNEWTAEIDFSFDAFSLPNTEYSKDLALLSVIGAAASYNYQYKKNISVYLADYMEKLGFENTEFFNDSAAKNRKPDADKVLFAIGKRKINVGNKTCNLIAIIARGTVLGEWFSNFRIGDGDFHEGFYRASEEIYRCFEEYTEKHSLTDKNTNIIWICGHSRGGAVVNILSEMLLRSAYVRENRIYAYTFASPFITRSQNRDAKVFNIVNSGDFIPSIPYWKGWRRFGTDIYTDSAPKTVREKTKDRFRKITAFEYEGFSQKEMTEIDRELMFIASDEKKFYTNRFNISAKGGKSPYEVCNMIGEMAVNYKISNLFRIPNEFNRLIGILLKTNIDSPKIIYAHSMEYYYSFVSEYDPKTNNSNNDI